MFSLFKPANPIGIDFGKEVKLVQKQDESFLTRAKTELDKELLEDFSKGPIVTAIRSDKIEIEFIDIDKKMDLEDIAKMVRLEFGDDSVVQQEIIDGENERYVIAMAIAKAEIEARLNLCRELALDLKVVETEFHANVRYLYQQYSNLAGTNLILDIGSEITNLIITINQELRFIRVFNFGGDLITKKLAKINEISFAEAEEKKNNDLDKEELKIILEELRSQIYHSIDYYQSKYKTEINRMFLTGSSAQLKGLKDYLEKQIGIDTTIVADPFFSVAKGLAMREID